MVSPQSLGLLTDKSTKFDCRRARNPGYLSLDSDSGGVQETSLFPQRAFARLPPCRAEVTEFLGAAASDVVAAVGELDEVIAAWAPPPALLLCEG